MSTENQVTDLRSLTAVEFVKWASKLFPSEPRDGITVEFLKCGPFMSVLPLCYGDLQNLIDVFQQGKYLAYVDHVTGGHSRTVTVTIQAPEGQACVYPSYATHTFTINATIFEEL